MTLTLQVEQLSCGYGAEPLVRGVSFALEAGRALAIVGPNGAGKTTLLRTLCGLLPAQAGRVLVRQADLARLGPPERARQVALLSQEDLGDASLTVRELVELGRTPYLGLWGRLGVDDRRAVDAAIEACHLAQLTDRPLSRLSGGERQRARIAMAIAQGTHLLLLDEPVNHLDLRRRFEFFELVARLRRERALATVMVLHDLTDAYREADTVLVVVNGTATPVPADDPQRIEKLARAFEVPEDRIAT